MADLQESREELSGRWDGLTGTSQGAREVHVSLPTSKQSVETYPPAGSALREANTVRSTLPLTPFPFTEAKSCPEMTSQTDCI